MNDFESIISRAITDALKRLLSEKHLYQSAEVDLSAIPNAAAQIRERIVKAGPNRSSMHASTALNKITEEGMQCAVGFWQPADPTLPGAVPVGSGDIRFQLPTINTFCSQCKASWPFNPVFDSPLSVGGASQQQWFYLGYQCQQCKRLPVRFLVRRDGLKLRLAGRDPIEILPTPKVLPKFSVQYFSDAQIAHHAGQTLAGLFLLRVFVEQFWRTVPAVMELLKKDPRATGERQGEVYQSTLPTDFKKRFPSLKDLYGRLSEALHAADANATLFEEASSKAVEHFDARRLFKIE